MARRRGKSTRRGKRPGQWYGFNVTSLVVDSAAIDALVIVPANEAIKTQAKGTYMGTRVSMQIAQFPVRSTGQVVKMNMQKSEMSAAAVGVNTIDPTSLDPFDLGNADILWWDLVNLPQNMGGLLADDEIMFSPVQTLVMKADRVLDQRRHGVIMAFRGDAALDSFLTLTARAYVKY